ncbi:polysaccharide pyruvyl transferase family protein [Kineococcus terrestris]|uniref:polysaccharide pyruvyl transferase family protein n=1 Tax=Kineococcus terrestris TaxID=2044856 RepID=UPI0034DB1EC9
MHVHVLGTVALNGGDAAILVAQRDVLREQWPGARVTASDTHPEAAGHYLPDVEFVPFLLPALVEAATELPERTRRAAVRVACARVKAAAELLRRGLRAPARAVAPRAAWPALDLMARADVLAYTGGTSLTDNYDLSTKVFDLQVAQRLGKPLVLLPQSAGPFTKPVNREALRPVLAAADLVLLRDERSLEHVVDVGADPARCAVVPDIVFALARPEALGAEPPHRDDDAPRLAVSVRDWAHFTGKSTEQGMRDYTAALRAAVTAAVRQRGARVTFVSTCQGRPEYVRDDSHFARTVAEGLPADVRERVEVDGAARSPEELIDFLATFDAMLSTRLHGAISAVCTGLPTLTIAYEYKTTEVWSQLGLDRWTVTIDEVDADVLAARVLDLLDQTGALRTTLAETVPPLREGARAVGGRVAAVLAGTPA